jgi:cytochrome c peroxidase
MAPVRATYFVVALAVAAVPAVWAATDEPIKPIKPAVIVQPALVELGKKLYFDPRLSSSGFISCNSCHNLSMGGSDNLKTSIGHNWQKGPINAPTVLNSSMNVAQFWDGRAETCRAGGGPIASLVRWPLPELPSDAGVDSAIRLRLREGVRGGPGEHPGDGAIAAFEDLSHQLAVRQVADGRSERPDGRGLEGYRLFKSALHGVTTARRLARRSAKWAWSSLPTDNPALSVAVTGRVRSLQLQVPTLRNVELTYPYP